MSTIPEQSPNAMPGSELFTERPTIVQTILVILILLASMYSASASADGPYLLWYNHPARNWNEALPIGNGRLGAMIYGNVYSERLQLNEETIWAGQPNNNANPEALEYLPKVRQLVWEADRGGMITFNAMLTSPHQDVVIQSIGDEIVLSSTTSNHEGLKGKVNFTGRVAATVKGGRLACREGVLSVSGADEAILYLSIATNFKHYDDITGNDTLKSESILREALTKDYARMKQEHTNHYKRYFDRVSLDLGPDEYAALTTDLRVERFKEHNDAHLVETYFLFGRYLLICTSQPGNQPPTLQGIWNDKMFPNWDSKYTTNINCEMNYWPAEVTNLSDLNAPLFSLIHDVSETGHQTARIMYGADGWVLHHNTDIWRVTGAIDKAPSGLWPTGGAWMCQHLWEHWLYTGDQDFLKEVYPIMTGAARFLNQIMVRHPQKGYWVVCPSLSPENQHPYQSTTAAGVTMDNELIRDLFSHVIEASQILKEPSALTDSLRDKLAGLPPLQIGKWGQLQEWLDDWDNPEDTHRHVTAQHPCPGRSRQDLADTPWRPLDGMEHGMESLPLGPAA